MMTYAIQLTNTSGVDLFLGEERSYVLHSILTPSGTVAGFEAAFPEEAIGTGYYGTSPPLAFIGSTQSGDLVDYTTDLFRGETDEWMLFYTGEFPRIFIFIPHPDDIGEGDYGIALYTETGAVSYSSNYKILQTDNLVVVPELEPPALVGDTVSVPNFMYPAMLSPRKMIYFEEYDGALPTMMKTVVLSLVNGQLGWVDLAIAASPVYPAQYYTYIRNAQVSVIDSTIYL